MTAIIAGSAVGATVLLSAVAIFAWLFFRKRQAKARNAMRSAGGISSEDFHNDSDGELDEKATGSDNKPRKSLTLPEKFWKSTEAAVPLPGAATMPAADAWGFTYQSVEPGKTANVDRLAGLSPTSSRSSIDTSSSYSSSDSGSTDLDMRSTHSSYTSQSVHSRRKSTGGPLGLDFTVDTDLASAVAAASGQDVTKARPLSGKVRPRSKTVSSGKSFSHHLRSLKRSLPGEDAEIFVRPQDATGADFDDDADRPAKPPRSSLRPLTQLLYSSNFTFEAEVPDPNAGPAPAIFVTDHPQALVPPPTPPTFAPMVKRSMSQADKRKSQATMGTNRQSAASRYSDYYPDGALQSSVSAQTFGGHITREDSSVIDPACASDVPALPTPVAGDIGYYQSLTQQGEADLPSCASSILSVESEEDIDPIGHPTDGRQQRSHSQDSDQIKVESSKSRRTTLVQAFPQPPPSPTLPASHDLKAGKHQLEESLTRFSRTDLTRAMSKFNAESHQAETDVTADFQRATEPANIDWSTHQPVDFAAAENSKRSVNKQNNSRIPVATPVRNINALLTSSSSEDTMLGDPHRTSFASSVAASVSSSSIEEMARVETAVLGTRYSQTRATVSHVAAASKQPELPQPRDDANQTEEVSDIWERARARKHSPLTIMLVAKSRLTGVRARSIGAKSLPAA